MCSRCHKPHERRGQQYCKPCHAAYMREWRKTHPLTPEQRRRSNARAYANVYLRRGRLKRRPCEVCGRRAEMHHEDYSRPLDVRWRCRRHHLEQHPTSRRRP